MGRAALVMAIVINLGMGVGHVAAGTGADGLEFPVKNETASPITITADDLVDGKRAFPAQSGDVLPKETRRFRCNTQYCSVAISFVENGIARSYDAFVPTIEGPCLHFFLSQSNQIWISSRCW